MNVRRGLVAEVRKKIVAELAKAGFVKRGHGCQMVQALTDDVCGVANFGTATQRGDGMVYAYLGIGVVHIELEHTIANLKGVDFSRHEASSYGTNLGYIMPEKWWKEWAIQDFSMIEITVSEMWQAFMKYGWPFMKEHTTLEAIYNLIKNEPLTGIWPSSYKVPVILHMMGEKGKAREYVEARLSHWKNEDYPAAQEYRDFAHNFLASL